MLPRAGDARDGSAVDRPVSVRSRILARVIDWVSYVLVGLGLVLVLVLGLRQLEVTLVALGDEGLVDEVRLSTAPGVEQDGAIALGSIIEKYEARLSQEVPEKFAWQSPMAALISEIRVEFPDEFSGAAIKDDVTGWIGFKGDAPAAAVEAIREFSRSVRPVEIVEHRGLSEKEILDRQWQVRQRQQYFGIRDHPESLEGLEQGVIALLNLPSPLDILLLLQLPFVGLVFLFVAEIPLTAIGGQTVGKTIANTKVVRIDDSAYPGWGRSLTRWAVLYLPLSVPIVGLLLFILMVVSPLFYPDRRGWYDRVAGTAVMWDTASRRAADHD